MPAPSWLPSEWEQMGNGGANSPTSDDRWMSNPYSGGLRTRSSEESCALWQHPGGDRCSGSPHTTTPIRADSVVNTS